MTAPHIPSQLIATFAALKPGDQFTVADIGFTSGHNWLATRQLFSEHAPQGARLHFIASEKTPVSASHFSPQDNELVAQLPPPATGVYRLHFGDHSLTLLYGHDHSELRFASAATASNARWQIDAWLTDKPSKASQPSNCQTPWHEYTPPNALTAGDHAVVIGAGIAGCLTANKLAQRGINVKLIDRHSDVAREGSGNAQGAIYGKLSNTDQPLNQLVLCSQIYSTRLYQQLIGDNADLGEQTGLIQLPTDQRGADMQALVAQQLAGCEPFIKAVNQQAASALAGVPLPSGGLYFGEAWWLAPGKLCQQLSLHPLITRVFDTHIESLEQAGKQWRAIDQHGQPHIGSQVVICCAKASDRLLPQLSSALRSVAGQTSNVSSTALAPLKRIVCAEAYVAPSYKGEHTTGASFHPNQDSIAVTDQDHGHNQTKLQTLFDIKIDSTVNSGHAAVRCATRDYIPLAGPVPDAEALQRDFEGLSHNKRADIEQLGGIIDGLWVLTGLGSRGLSYAPLCAEWLVANICHEPPPIGLALQKALSPARFIVRDIIRTNRN